MAILERPDARNPALSLLQRVKLIAVSLGWWHGNYKLKDAKITIAGESLTEGTATQPQVKLLSQTAELREYRTKFGTLNTQRRDIADFYSEDFPINGVRQVPHAVVPAMLYELVGKVDETGKPVYDFDRFVPRTGDTEQSVAYRLHTLADEFAASWPRLRLGLEAAVSPAVWQNVRKRLPSDNEIRKKFYLDVATVELAVGNDDVEASVETLDSSRLQDYAQYMRTSMQRQVDAAVEQLVAGPRLALGTALKSLNELIARDGRVTARSFNAVNEAIAKLRMFDFASNSELISQIAGLERRIGATNAAELDASAAASNGFLELTTGIIRAVEDVAAIDADIARFGRQRRSITL